MAKGGKDVEIVIELENVQSFTQFLTSKPGLIVCECYQDWAGPCVVMKRFLKKAKFEFFEGEDLDLVHYCSIKVEAVPAFKNLRGHCIPTYLFFGGKKFIHLFRGYQPSLLMPLIKEMLMREKLCMAGEAKRNLVSDVVPYLIPEEDPPLAELEILETPVAPTAEDETPALLEEPAAAELEEKTSEKEAKRSTVSDEMLLTLASHQKRSHYPESQPDEVTTESGAEAPTAPSTAPEAEITELQNPEKRTAQLAVGETPTVETDTPTVVPADLQTVHTGEPLTQVPGINQPEPNAESSPGNATASLPEPSESTPAPVATAENAVEESPPPAVPLEQTATAEPTAGAADGAQGASEAPLNEPLTGDTTGS
ncbi:mucin-7-like [Paramacrobiotus metropolitanus]|uniref:mucin-7-like n=1 Tax=Paramacrobiotus metropolitanus TaxID=2943436 RepID=UPI0024465205|nr:mucin-7-like [Paramacrobiotus metropolitanus]